MEEDGASSAKKALSATYLGAKLFSTSEKLPSSRRRSDDAQQTTNLVQQYGGWN